MFCKPIGAKLIGPKLIGPQAQQGTLDGRRGRTRRLDCDAAQQAGRPARPLTMVLRKARGTMRTSGHSAS